MTDQVDRQLVVPVAPETVWEVITADGWLADSVEMDLVPGGEARFISEDSVRAGWIEFARPPGADGSAAGRLVFWWSDDGEPASRVELELEPYGEGGTALRVIEARPLELLEVVGVSLPGSPGPGGAGPGPAMLLAV